MSSNLKGKFFAIIGPSSVGKNTLIEKYLNKNKEKISFLVSATSRFKRNGEKNGINYFFLSKEEFEKKIKNQEFIEWAKVFENYYGVLKETLFTGLEKGDSFLKDIDIQGANSLIKSLPKENLITIFIEPPSIKELENRIRQRDLDDEKAIQTRLRDAKYEMNHCDKFDYRIINDNFDKCYLEFEKIVNNNLI